MGITISSPAPTLYQLGKKAGCSLFGVNRVRGPAPKELDWKTYFLVADVIKRTWIVFKFLLSQGIRSAMASCLCASTSPRNAPTLHYSTGQRNLPSWPSSLNSASKCIYLIVIRHFGYCGGRRRTRPRTRNRTRYNTNAKPHSLAATGFWPQSHLGPHCPGTGSQTHGLL